MLSLRSYLGVICDKLWLKCMYQITKDWYECPFSLKSKGKVAIKFPRLYSLYSSHFTLMKVLLSMRSIYKTPLRWSISCCSILAGHPLACQLTGSAFSLRPLERRQTVFIWYFKEHQKVNIYRLSIFLLLLFFTFYSIIFYLRLLQIHSVERMLNTHRCSHMPLGRWQCVHLVHATVGLQKS